MSNVLMQGRPIQQEADAIIEYLEAHCTEGDAISHQTLLDLTKESQRTMRYYQIINRARRDLLERTTIYLASERGVGYRLLVGREQLESGVRGFHGVVKRAVTEHHKMSVIPDDRLPDTHDRAVRDYEIDIAGRLVQAAKSERLKLTAALKKSDAGPRVARLVDRLPHKMFLGGNRHGQPGEHVERPV